MKIIDRLILKGQRVLIPESLPAPARTSLKLYTMLNEGLEKERRRQKQTKNEAQGQRFSVLEWVNQDTEKLVKACLKNMPSQTSETLLPRGIPSGPMQTPGADLFQFNNADTSLNKISKV